MILLLIIPYVIIGIFIATFIATYQEKKRKIDWTEEYGNVFAIVLVGAFWPLLILTVPVFAMIYLVGLVVKAASWCSNELLAPRENV